MSSKRFDTNFTLQITSTLFHGYHDNAKSKRKRHFLFSYEAESRGAGKFTLVNYFDIFVSRKNKLHVAVVLSELLLEWNARSVVSNRFCMNKSILTVISAFSFFCDPQWPVNMKDGYLSMYKFWEKYYLWLYCCVVH